MKLSLVSWSVSGISGYHFPTVDLVSLIFDIFPVVFAFRRRRDVRSATICTVIVAFHITRWCGFGRRRVICSETSGAAQDLVTVGATSDVIIFFVNCTLSNWNVFVPTFVPFQNRCHS